MTPTFSRNFTCIKCEGNIGEAVEQEEKLCDEVKTLREFTYIGDRVSVGVGCEAAVVVRTRCGWVKLRECSELLHGRRFPLKLKAAIYKSCKACITVWKCSMVSESEIRINQRTERSMVTAMCGIQHKHRKRFTHLMLM